MGGEEDSASGAVSGGRKTFWRSASWSSSRTSSQDHTADCPSDAAEKGSANGGQFRRCPAPPLTPRSQSGKARSCLPPLQPLSIARRSLDEWPRAGSDDLGEWPQPPTPGGHRPGEGLKLDLSSLRSGAKKDQIAFFDKECSKVADHIYLGGDAVARNREILRQNGITHVLNCVGFVCPEYFKSDLVYKTLWLQDSPTEDITSILYDVFDYFEDVRQQGGRVLVHCCQGVSRSTSLVIAYLMWRKGQSFDDAFQLVKAARGIANPNMGFACQLLQCQKRVHAFPLSPNSVLRMYRMAPHSPYDPLHLVPKMLTDPSPAALDSRGAFIVHVLSSIYVWVGAGCKPAMEKDAKAAAFQVVRYERVQGPVLMVVEGEEPSEFWDAFSNGPPPPPPPPPSSDSAVKAGMEQVEAAAVKTGGGNRRVDSYDADFELFYKALSGGVVPPFSSSGPGQETCLPARESNWSILRRKFISGTIFRVYADSALARDTDLGLHQGQLLAADSSTSPPYLSPSSLSSDSSGSSKCSSESPSLSPPTSSPSRAPLGPSNSSDCQPLSSRPSEPCSEGVCSPSKGFARCIAERRRSFSPLKLPTLNKGASLLSRKLPAYLGSLQEVLERNNDGTVSDDALGSESRVGHLLDVNSMSETGFDSAENLVDHQKNHIAQDSELLPGLTASGDARSEATEATQPLVYRWPNMQKIATFSRSDLDPKTAFLLLTPNTGRSGQAGRMLYMWVGSGFEPANGQTQPICGRDVEEGSAVDWHRVGCDFLALMGLPEDLPIKVIKEQETQKFLEMLNST